MSSNMNVWKLSKDEIDSYVPGQDLGQPHKTEEVKFMSRSPVHKYDCGAKYDQVPKKSK